MQQNESINKVLVFISTNPGYFNAVNIQKDIPYQDLPDYNSWSCEQWVSFHKKLKSLYGQKDANQVWKEFFNNKPHGWTGDKCTRNEDFVDYFKKQGIKFDTNSFSIIVNLLPPEVKTALIVGGVLFVAVVGTLVIYNVVRIAKEANSLVGGVKKLRQETIKDPTILLKMM